MIQRLSSVKLTFYTLVTLIGLLGAGVFFSGIFKEEFNLMNETQIFTWFAHAWDISAILVLWFVLLCACAALLFINALCCTFSRQLFAAKKTGLVKNWFFFILHCLFIIVLACHGLILIVGEKQGGIIRAS